MSQCTGRLRVIKDRHNNIEICHDNIDILERFQGSFINDGWLEGVLEGSEALKRLHFGRFTAAPNMIDLTCHFPGYSSLRKAINYHGRAGN